ncbi:MAG: hypothetical protein ABIJ45_00875, partial [Candidatus Zixiibacteriota bacterium]
MHYGPKEKDIINDLHLVCNKTQDVDITRVEQIDEIDFSAINPISKSAIVSALINRISGKTENYPWELAGLRTPSKIKTSFTVSINEPDKILAEIKNLPYSIIKIKLGSENDEELLRRLSGISSKLFRFDVNGGWTMEIAEKMFFYLNKLEADLIEQPTPIEL